MDELLCWIETNSGLASWLQAFGSLIAIGLTLFLWRHDVASRNKQDESAAFGLAVSIADELYQLKYSIEWLIEKFPEVPNMIPSHGRNYQLHEGIKVPEKMEKLDGRLHELGELALPIQSLMLGMRRVEKLAERKMWTIRAGKEATKQYDEEIITIVYSLKVDIDRATEMIKAYFSKARSEYTHA
ncbi:hypothetical protein CRN53_08615 [Vibrio vulnificus]|uniref:hypothetical protein n=1 Tax=Vibrio vulnificus TaxID=672 RepID=UPI000CD0E8C1|nr:hypothetical protein [Vibrio vulnificus]POB95054.1 hypothetical protein CRN53_08615 [Vibrio vulnificus]